MEMTPCISIPRDPENPAAFHNAEAQASIRAAGWWKRAGLDELWPLSTTDAARLLARAGEFDVDADGLVELVRRKILPSPATDGGRLVWNASDVILANGVLEARMQWRPAPSGHDLKKHSSQVLIELARSEGKLAEALVDTAGGKRYDLRHVAVMMARCDAMQGRLLALAMLFTILEVEHGIKA